MRVTLRIVGVESSTEPASRRAAGRGAIGRGRGPVRSAVQRMLAERREAEAFSAVLEVRALVAERYAELVDRAAAAGDDVALVKAGDKLLEVLGSFGATAGGGGSGDSSGERGRVFSILDGPPTVGHAADG